MRVDDTYGVDVQYRPVRVVARVHDADRMWARVDARLVEEDMVRVLLRALGVALVVGGLFSIKDDLVVTQPLPVPSIDPVYQDSVRYS